VEEDEAFTTGRAYDSWVSSIFLDVIANGLPYVFEHHHGSDPAVGGSTSLIFLNKSKDGATSGLTINRFQSTVDRFWGGVVGTTNHEPRTALKRGADET
jgi:hypothetical protein